MKNTKDKGKPKYQSENKERKWIGKTQEGANKGGYFQRKRPECTLCRKKGHTLTRCFIFMRAQKILKTKYNEREVKDFKRINDKDKNDKRLNDLKVNLMNEIQWADAAGDTDVEIAINCLLDEEELYEIDLVSADEESDEESGGDLPNYDEQYESEADEESE